MWLAPRRPGDGLPSQPVADRVYFCTSSRESRDVVSAWRRAGLSVLMRETSGPVFWLAVSGDAYLIDGIAARVAPSALHRDESATWP